MAKARAMLLGWVNYGHQAQCGETVKNQYILDRLRKCGVDVIVLDFYRWKRHPWVILKFFGSLLAYPHTPLILSTAPKNVYFMMKWHNWLHSSRKVIHWVIGGNLHQLVRRGEIGAKYIKDLHINIVESPEMVDWLAEDGVTNTRYLANFKPIPYKPVLKPQAGKKRFVFISRIKPEKGVDYIFEAMRQLNIEGYQDQYEVDLFGRIDEDYKDTFFNHVKAVHNARYGGFLDLSSPASYDALSEYTAMLFPTYWKSEGFSGIFIDAFIAGLPIIASDWNHNFEILTQGETGIKIPPHDPKALAEAMRSVITGDTDLEAMRALCQSQADAYDSNLLVTPHLLQEIGIINK